MAAKTGATGQRGRKGVAGKSGRRGDRGKPGPRGRRGPENSPHSADELHKIVMHFADVYEQLTAHMKKLGHLQRQLDALVEPRVHDTGDRASTDAMVQSLNNARAKSKL